MKPPLNMSRSNKPLTQEANSSAHIDRAHQLAQDFNSKQDDTALTSLPHKNPDIFRFENNITAHSSRRGSLYRDSDATVVLPLSEHTPRLSMDDPYRQLLQQAEISQLRSKKKGIPVEFCVLRLYLCGASFLAVRVGPRPHIW